MPNRWVNFVAVAGFALTSACAPARPAAAPGPQVQASAEARAAAGAQVQGVIDQWVSAFNRDDAAGVANTYAPNGEQIVGGLVARRAAIQDVIARRAPQSTDFVVADRNFGVVGDRAWETGVAMQTITPASGQPYHLFADYVALLARQPDGSWKIQTLISGNQRQQPIR